jgi:formylglycine-generating enzyme required for sulfatase activity/CheY-like chemotaxis protein
MPRILVIQPDPEFRENLQSLLQQKLPFVELLVTTNLEEAQNALEMTGPVDALITEVYFVDGDGLTYLQQFREANPNVFVLLATRYDLSEYRPYLGDLPEILYPFDPDYVAGLVTDRLNLLEGVTWHPYRIDKRNGSDRWGNVYQAYHLVVKRPANLTVLRAGATQQEIQQFQAASAYLARAGHPNVTAVYEAGEHEGRYFFLREIWGIPSLEEYARQGRVVEPRMAARVIHVCTTVLIFWETNQYRHPLIQPGDITLTNTGVVKIINIVDPALPDTANLPEQMKLLATTLKNLLPKGVDLPPKLTGLLAAMEQGGMTINQIGLSAQALDAELAPKQVVVKTREQVEAEQALERAKKQREMILQLGAGALMAVILGLVAFFYFKFKEPPSHEYIRMLKVPSGSFLFQDTESVEIADFWMDEYEVTIGQYKKFLSAIKGKDMSPYEHPDMKGQVRSYAPKEWVGMIEAVRSQQTFSNQLLTLDSPVFGVDYYSAYAYAKWAGKRLPTEQEWEKAARGPKMNKYPWGNEPDQKKANAGFGFYLGAPDKAIAVDGFYGVCPVDAKDTDESYYGIRSLAGNVSEWTSSDGPPKLGLPTQSIRGGNFQTTKIENIQRVFYIRDTSERWLGFRCVSDTPPVEKAK